MFATLGCYGCERCNIVLCVVWLVGGYVLAVVVVVVYMFIYMKYEYYEYAFNCCFVL